MKKTKSMIAFLTSDESEALKAAISFQKVQNYNRLDRDDFGVKAIFPDQLDTETDGEGWHKWYTYHLGCEESFKILLEMKNFFELFEGRFNECGISAVEKIENSIGIF